MPPNVEIGQDPVALEVLRQAREQGEQGLQALQVHVQQALQELRQQVAAHQGGANGALRGAAAAGTTQADGGLGARIAALERLLGPRGAADGAARRLLLAKRNVREPGVQLARQLGNIKIQAPPSFTGSNNPEEWGNFSFKLKMYLGITMPIMVTNMEVAEGDGHLFTFAEYPQDVQDQARALMARLASLCVDTAAAFARAQVDSGNRHGGYKL